MDFNQNSSNNRFLFDENLKDYPNKNDSKKTDNNISSYSEIFENSSQKEPKQKTSKKGLGSALLVAFIGTVMILFMVCFGIYMSSDEGV
ncbi:MAG: hypothetical protein ACI4QE_02310, partial [Acutalibacteraceae bacterium]